jgi:hypothetical protein
VLPALAGTAAVGFLCWGAWMYGYHPDWLNHTHSWWGAALASYQDWTLLVTLALWFAGLGCFWWPRRREHQPIGLIIVVAMVLIAAVLGTTSYLPCRNHQTATGVMFWVLQLYVGQPANNAYPSGGSTCLGTLPLALQLGQGVGLGATLVGAATAVAAVLWKDPVQRIQSRFARNATVFTGLDQRTLPLLLVLTRQAADPQDIIVIEPDADNILLNEARLAGARVVIGDPAGTRLLEPIICGLRACALRRLYALSSKVQDNERVMTTARQILQRYTAPPDPLPHLVTLIDDPRHAESWRSQHPHTTAHWFEDALNPAESTAVTLADQLQRCGAQQVLLCGDSSLAPVLLHELACRSWEQAELVKAAGEGHQIARADGFHPGEAPPSQSVRRVTLLDPRAVDTRREYRATVPAEFINYAPTVEAMAIPWRERLLYLLDSMPTTLTRNTAVVIVDTPDEFSMHEAGRIARLHTELPVFVLSPPGHGMPEAIFGQLRTFERGLLADGRAPEDSWSRVARHWHDCYRLSHPVPAGHPKAAARLSWADVDDFIRQDNIMQVHSILSAVAGLGRRWAPARTVVPGSFIELSEQDIRRVAEAEHTRWQERHVAAGWSADDTAARRLPWTAAAKPARRAARTNPLVVPWANLREQQRADNCRWVTGQLAQLETMGFMPAVPAGGPPAAADFERTGSVQARRLTGQLRWTLRSGEEMLGNPGDWHVIDDDGNARTVTDPEFRSSHQPVSDGTWERVGIHRAWRVTEAVIVRTKEGPATAHPGDWLLEGPAGERWPVCDAEFRRGYRPVEDRAIAGQSSMPTAASSSTPAGASSSTPAVAGSTPPAISS